MSKSKGVVLRVKNNSGGYTELSPRVITTTIVGWNIGEQFGPYEVMLKASDWVGNKQTVALNGVNNLDFVKCTLILDGTKEQMLAQSRAYNMLQPNGGLETTTNALIFYCTKTPEVDIRLQIWWNK